VKSDASKELMNARVHIDKAMTDIVQDYCMVGDVKSRDHSDRCIHELKGQIEKDINNL
jgi:hypothetical protein